MLIVKHYIMMKIKHTHARARTRTNTHTHTLLVTDHYSFFVTVRTPKKLII